MKPQNNSFILFNDWTVNNTNMSSPPPQVENHLVYGHIFLFPVCAFLIVSNTSLLYIILSNRKKAWAKQTKHILYLIVCDLIVGVLLIPIITVRLLGLQKKAYWVCAVLTFTTLSSQTVSYYHMLAVCIHRYRRVKKITVPFGYDRYRYGVESVFIWATVLLAFVPPYLILEQKDTTPQCGIDYIFGPSEITAIIYILVLCSLPGLLTNVVYVAVLCSMRTRCITVQPVTNHTVYFRNTQCSATPNTTGAQVSIVIQPSPTNNVVGLRTNKVNKVIGYLLFALNISLLAPTITFGMKLGGFNTVPVGIQVLTYINNVSSPFIYFFSIPPLREELKSTLRASLSRVKSVITCQNGQR